MHSLSTVSLKLPEIVASDLQYSIYYFKEFKAPILLHHFIVFSCHLLFSILLLPTPFSLNEINHFILTYFISPIFNILTFIHCTFISSIQLFMPKISLQKSQPCRYYTDFYTLQFFHQRLV